MGDGDRKGRGLMAETLEIAEILDVPAPKALARKRLLLRSSALRPATPNAFLASSGAALAERRLFALLPLAMVLGVIGFAGVGWEREPVVVGAGAAVIAVCLVLAARSVVLLRLAAIAAVLWI